MPQKMQMAIELWRSMPQATVFEFLKAFTEKHGTTVSLSIAQVAKRNAGVTRPRKSKKLNIDQLHRVRNRINKNGGASVIRRQMEKLSPLVKEAGGFDRLWQCLELLDELKMS